MRPSTLPDTASQGGREKRWVPPLPPFTPSLQILSLDVSEGGLALSAVGCRLKVWTQDDGHLEVFLLPPTSPTKPLYFIFLRKLLSMSIFFYL